MAGKKITYLFGAGASANSVPILNSLTLKMRAVAEELIIYSNPSTQLSGKIPLDDLDGFGKKYFLSFIIDLKVLASKSDEYGTIDTYAKKLELNNENDELKKLKFLVSIFFAIWQGYFYKNELIANENGVSSKYSDIDKRYKSLVSNYLIKNSNKEPKLDENVNFISWNYDNQLESAFALFYRHHLNLSELNEQIKFLPDNRNFYEHNRILHLNGISNFWINDSNILDRIFQNDDELRLSSLVRRIAELYRPHNFSKCTSLINYAWDNNSSKLQEAKRIFNQTNILVIIGYSFPTFNRQIDSELLLGNNVEFDEVIYQDPNANEDSLSMFNFNIKNNRVSRNRKKPKLLKNTDQFYIPPEYFPSPETSDNWGNSKALKIQTKI